MSTLFVPREVVTDETRVAATPETVKRLVRLGFDVMIEAGAGEGSQIADQEYSEAGAQISTTPREDVARADVIVKFHPPTEHPSWGVHEVDTYKKGALLVAFVWPLVDPSLAHRLAERGVTVFSMDMVPRISRAQSMDALSSQSNIAGYKAVLMAAEALPLMFPLMMTAAGTIKPAKVVIIGAGVAGLQAIATAKRLGATVQVSDIRPAVKEQVESLGGKFIEVETDEELEDQGGYAKEASEDFKRRQREVLAQRIAEANVVITTALIPGRPAPKLVFEDMVKSMKSGSVIVDLAAEQGGNCELTEPGEVVVKEGVTIIGKRLIPSLLPVNASEMYAKNILTVLQHLFPKGEYTLDFEDEITVGSVVAHEGHIRSSRVRDAYTEATGKSLPALPAPAKSVESDDAEAAVTDAPAEEPEAEKSEAEKSEAEKSETTSESQSDAAEPSPSEKSETAGEA